MNDAKRQPPRVPPGPGEKSSAHSVAFPSALAQKSLRSRHSPITADLYTYHGYKVWTAKIRNTFDEPK